MNQHALGSDGKLSNVPSHKDSGKRSRERLAFRGIYGCVHWTEKGLKEREEEEEEGKEAEKKI